MVPLELSIGSLYEVERCSTSVRALHVIRRREHFDEISFIDVARTDHVCIEAQSAAKSTDDVPEYGGILLTSIRIVRRHDAAAAEAGNGNLRVRQSQSGAGPAPLANSVDALDEDVRTQSSNIATKHRHGSVRADEQRQDVESLGALESLQPRAWCDGGLNARGYFG